jgi:hypothetical protein
MKINLNFIYSTLFRVIIFGLLGTISLIFVFRGCEKITCQKETEIYTLGPESLPIPFDSLHSLGSTLEYLGQTYCGNHESRLPLVYFNLKAEKFVSSPKKGLPVNIEPAPCAMEIEYEFDNILEIHLDGNNILIEEKRMPLDSVGQYVYYQYMNYGERKGFSQSPDGNGIWLITEKARPLADLAPILARVLRGYKETLEFVASNLYGKELCELSDEEWERIHRRMGFHLALKYSDDIEPILRIE